MAAGHEIEELRHRLAAIERKGALGARGAFSLGVAEIDGMLNGPQGAGLALGALHEIYAHQAADAPAACAIALAFVMRAAGGKPIVWVRQDFAAIEMGEIHAPGLVELGLDPERLVLVRVRDGPSALRAAEEAARCPALGAVLIELWGQHRSLDLVATRRLSLAAEGSGVPLIMMRAGASPTPSAAATRWRVRAAPSIPLEADAPGHPAFVIDLVRSRAGPAGRSWNVDWNRDQRSFHLHLPEGPAAAAQPLSGPLSGGVAAASVGGSHPAGAPAQARRESV
jgi:protein ImuA